MLLIDDVFEMGSGFVLTFSDTTFWSFFADELGVDIDAPTYRVRGRSKAKRLRCFLQTVDAPMAARALRALWEYREGLRTRANREEDVADAEHKMLSLIHRLEGKPEPARKQAAAPPAAPAPHPARKVDVAKLALLRGELLSMASMAPHARGFAFEKLLKNLFDAYGLEARDAFRLRGEQIDGSFQLREQTYLLEAKWQAGRTDASDLRIFNSKLDEKAAWARGLFVSDSGFSEDGLAAFGRAKKLICMDGLDLYETLERQIPIDEVISLKARRAVETGRVFVPVRDLYPR